MVVCWNKIKTFCQCGTDNCLLTANILAKQNEGSGEGKTEIGKMEKGYKEAMLLVKVLTFPIRNGTISFCPTFRLEMEYDVIPSVSSIT